MPDRIRKKSVSGPPGRKQSTTMAPMISVSSVAETTEADEPYREDDPLESPVEIKTAIKQSSKVLSDEPATSEKNDVCPWEDE